MFEGQGESTFRKRLPDRPDWVTPEAMQVNTWFVVIVVSLVVLWKVDLLATFLNLKSLEPEIPVSFRDVRGLDFADPRL